jgi:hypothetical protein
MMVKLEQLMARCKCGVHLNINAHRNIYEHIVVALNNFKNHEITKEVHIKIIETDTLIDLQFYPDTPGGFYQIVHYSLDSALNEALAIAKIGAQ